MGQRRHAFTLSDGTVIYGIIGADSGDEEDDDDEDEDVEDEDDSDDDEDDDEAGSSGKKTRKQLEQELADAAEERDRAIRRMKSADKAKAKAERERDALKNGGTEALTTAQARVTELEAELAARSGTDKSSIVKEYFNDSDQFTWHERKVAFSLLDLDEVDVDEDTGKLDEASLTSAIKKLAKEHPYLVKPAVSTTDDEDEEEDTKPKPTSGAPVRGRKPVTKQKTKAQHESKFPILQQPRI